MLLIEKRFIVTFQKDYEGKTYDFYVGSGGTTENRGLAHVFDERTADDIARALFHANQKISYVIEEA